MCNDEILTNSVTIKLDFLRIAWDSDGEVTSPIKQSLILDPPPPLPLVVSCSIHSSDYIFPGICRNLRFETNQNEIFNQAEILGISIVAGERSRIEKVKGKYWMRGNFETEPNTNASWWKCIGRKKKQINKKKIKNPQKNKQHFHVSPGFLFSPDFFK